MRTRWVSVAVVLVLSAATASSYADVLNVHYDGFTVWVDCDRRGAVLFHYVAQPDTGSFPRHGSYDIDHDVRTECQSKSTETFQSVLTQPGLAYDVGHLAPANHFDGSERSIRETNHWTNLLPQTASMNRGAWLETEYLIECWRDVVPLEVWGGPIWGANFTDDYFVESHGIQTPAAFWKVVIRTDDRDGIAWIIPNRVAPRGSLDSWLVSISMVERVTGLGFDVVDRISIPLRSWQQPAGCDIQ